MDGDFRIANLDRREDHWYDVKARLASGVTHDQAQEAMNAQAARLAEEYPELNEGRDITVFPTQDIRLHPDADGALFPVAALLMAVVVLILILASSNLGGLLLVGAYLTVLPLLLTKTILKPIRRQTDIVRFSVVVVLLLFMLSMPLKMLGRWLINLKYVVYIPEYFINL